MCMSFRFNIHCKHRRKRSSFRVHVSLFQPHYLPLNKTQDSWEQNDEHCVNLNVTMKHNYLLYALFIVLSVILVGLERMWFICSCSRAACRRSSWNQALVELSVALLICFMCWSNGDVKVNRSRIGFSRIGYSWLCSMLPLRWKWFVENGHQLGSRNHLSSQHPNLFLLNHLSQVE